MVRVDVGFDGILLLSTAVRCYKARSCFRIMPVLRAQRQAPRIKSAVDAVRLAPCYAHHYPRLRNLLSSTPNPADLHARHARPRLSRGDWQPPGLSAARREEEMRPLRTLPCRPRTKSGIPWSTEGGKPDMLAGKSILPNVCRSCPPRDHRRPSPGVVALLVHQNKTPP